MAPKRKHVVVIGGGVAGLTAAQELLEKGLDVTLCERRAIFGGKSRSYQATLFDDNGRRVRGSGRVPAEHGFRFFAGFYEHLDHTMGRIVGRDGRPVRDHLVPIHEELLGVSGRSPFKLSVASRKVRDIHGLFRFPDDLLTVGLTPDDLHVFASKLWQLATSCPERRDSDYEQIGWRDFVESMNRSDEYYWYLASGLTRALVAARARKASTKTMGNVFLKLLRSLVDLTGQRTMDRVLDGPTNKVWIEPWCAYLKKEYGSRFTLRPQSKLIGVNLRRGGSVESVTVEGLTPSGRATGAQDDIPGDFFVSALSLNGLAEHLKADTAFEAAGGPQFKNIEDLSIKHTQWMSGLQIYFAKDDPISPGHQLYLDSPWGLTSISQAQFWKGDYFPHGIGGVLSVDISSWDLPGLKQHNAAQASTLREIYFEVKAQIRGALGSSAIPDSNIVGWRLDDSILNQDSANPLGVQNVNIEPILVNDTGSWELRPTAKTALPNFFIAGDFARTNTDLACMEGANEAARRAANEILARCGLESCWLADTPDLLVLRPFQQMDLYRYRRGLPWAGPELGLGLVTVSKAGATLADAALGKPKLDDPGVRWGTVPSPSQRRTKKAKGKAIRPQQSLVGARRAANLARDVPFHLPRSQWDKGGDVDPRIRALTPQQIEERIGVKYESAGRADPMFKRWRLYALGRDLVPFHAYDADSLIIHGQVRNFRWLEQQVAGTKYHPVYAIVGGKKVGYAELWVIHYSDTTAGPYNEVVINFVVRKDESREYCFRSPYSSIVPMNDPQNRLFTPRLLLQELRDKPPAPRRSRGAAAPPKPSEPQLIGPIEYGNKLFGLDKRPAEVIIERKGDMRQFAAYESGKETLAGRINEATGNLRTLIDSAELARELGAVELAMSIEQTMTGAELSGGLLTKDHRNPKAPVVDVRASYKFTPMICTLRGNDPEEFRYDPRTPFGKILDDMDFTYQIATRDPHLKSVLYIDRWPTPFDP